MEVRTGNYCLLWIPLSHNEPNVHASLSSDQAYARRHSKGIITSVPSREPPRPKSVIVSPTSSSSSSSASSSFLAAEVLTPRDSHKSTSTIISAPGVPLAAATTTTQIPEQQVVSSTMPSVSPRNCAGPSPRTRSVFLTSPPPAVQGQVPAQVVSSVPSPRTRSVFLTSPPPAQGTQVLGSIGGDLTSPSRTNQRRLSSVSGNHPLNLNTSQQGRVNSLANNLNIPIGPRLTPGRSTTFGPPPP